jgi:hypothetical protein
VQKYLEGKVGGALEGVSNAMLELVKSLQPSQLAEKVYTLYEKFRPEIPPGKNGWGLRHAGPGPHPQDGFGLTLSSVCLATASRVSMRRKLRGRVSAFNKGDLAKEIEPRQKGFTLLSKEVV